MSANKKELVYVAVTGGDAIANNRLSGKSNTGTYFICSFKNWDDFKEYFDRESVFSYYLDLKKIKTYKVCFIEMFFDRRKLYADEMKNFADICDSLILYNENPKIDFELRINDSRIFLKFANNQKEIEYALRNIIYSDLTLLVFDKESKSFYLDIKY